MNLLEIKQSEKGKMFARTANAQRGEPEIIMVQLQHKLGGGVYSFVIEHVGDLTHRMTEHFDFLKGQRGNIEDKVRKTLRILEQGYGFEREHRENMENNFRVRKERNPESTFEEFKSTILEFANRYADAHRKIPVFNEAQRRARQAAIDLGEYDFDSARRNLNWLADLVKDKDRYYQEVSKVEEEQ